MYQTLIIGEHRVDDRGYIELLGPDSLACFVPSIPRFWPADAIMCEDGVPLKVRLPVALPPPGFVLHYQVTAAHQMIKSYRPEIGERALLIQEAQKRGLRVRVPSESRQPAARAGCRCDIRNLMSTGHDAGCPERR